MDGKPDTIHVNASHREEVQATHADLFISVRGSSVVGGSEAMKKAKEVSVLAEELKQAGVSAEDIHLQGVQLESSSGMILKSTSAVYRLRVSCKKLESLPALLDILGAQKNAALERIEWNYDDESARARGLTAAIEAAKQKAEQIAAALGVKLLGVYGFNENAFDEDAPQVRMLGAQAMMKTERGLAPVEPSLDLDIQHAKTIQVNVDVEFRVSTFQ